MTDDDVIAAMLTYGGNFVSTLAQLWQRGDPVNRARIRAAFEDYFAEYAAIAREEQRRLWETRQRG